MTVGASLNIEVKYADTLIRRLRETFPTASVEGVQEAIATVAERIADEARRLAPVRTGYLRSTIGVEPGGRWFYKLFARAYYAPFVEWGTRRMEPRLFMTRALQMHQVELYQAVVEAVEKVVQNSFR